MFGAENRLPLLLRSHKPAKKDFKICELLTTSPAFLFFSGCVFVRKDGPWPLLDLSGRQSGDLILAMKVVSTGTYLVVIDRAARRAGHESQLWPCVL